MTSLNNFLSHGTLPFTGRDDELQRLLAFWRARPSNHEMISAMLVGEAGIGKSRLVDELAAHIQREKGILIRIKLFAGATFSLTHLLVKSITSSPTAVGFIKSDLRENMASTMTALHRLARLRPTLLVFEDIHLLPKESLGELSIILDALSTEFIKVLFVARPVESGTRPLTEQQTTIKISLSSLTDSDLERLWCLLFDSPPEKDVVSVISKTTLGNPLAVRSALRGALQLQILRLDPSHSQWRPSIPMQAFELALARFVEMLPEGLAANLSDEELAAARRFAFLGEVFARTTARAWHDGADPLIDSLVSKGILVVSTESLPLLGDSEGDVFRFTHTLLHRHLVRPSHALPADLIHLIAQDLPLYSILPFQLLADCEQEILPTEDAVAVLDRFDHIMQKLWKGGSHVTTIFVVCYAADRLFAAVRSSWGPERQRITEIDLLQPRAVMLMTTFDFLAAERIVETIVALASPVTNDDLAFKLVEALYIRFVCRLGQKDPAAITVWNECEEWIARFPAILTRAEYTEILSTTGHFVRATTTDNAPFADIGPRMDFMISSPTVPEHMRARALTCIGTLLLTYFTTPEQLAERLEMAESLYKEIGNDTWAFIVPERIRLFDSVGLADRLIAETDQWIPQARMMGLDRLTITWDFRRLLNMTAFGYDLAQLEGNIASLFQHELDTIPNLFRSFLGERLMEVGLLRGDLQWAERMYRRYAGEALQSGNYLVLIELRNRKSITDELLENVSPDIATIGRATREIEQKPENLARTAAEFLQKPILRIQDLLQRAVVIELVDAASLPIVNVPGIPILHDQIRTAVSNMLDWLGQRESFAYMKPFLDRYGQFLTIDEREQWTRLIADLEHRRHKAVTTETDMLRISMIGEITIAHGNAVPVPVRGARNRTLLALMAAQQLLRRKLSQKEFAELASGVTNDPEYAGRLTRTAISRLRALLGHEAIVTEGGIADLELRIVSVDVIDAHRKIGLVMDAIGGRAVFQAYELILDILKLVGSEVVFPTQYENFFEAMREDFEHRLRSAVLQTASLLYEEGDIERAEEILRRSFDAMPDDLELAEFLEKILVQLNRRAEAERLRMRLAHAA